MDSLRTELFIWKRKKDELGDFIRESYPQSSELRDMSGTEISLKKTQNFLDRSSALIQYFWGKDSVYAILLTRNQLYCASLTSVEQLKPAIQTFLPVLHSPGSLAQDFSSKGYILYQKLIAPLISKASSEIKHFTLIPDGPLGFLPFHVLPQTAGNTLQDFRKIPYLLNDFDISYAYSAQSLFNQKKTNEKPEKEFVAFAPSYPQGLTLAFNQEEVERSHEILSGDLFMQKQATKVRFGETAPKARIFHLAMHGLADTTETMNAHLLFQDPKKEGASEKLYAYEIYNMNFQAELAVLSACETGFGKLEQGEGVMSLARAFRQTGCKSVLMSLWEADGKASVELMENFYQHLKNGDPKSKAISASQRDYLKTATPEFVHPYFWANFVLIGNQDPLHSSQANWGLLAVSILVLGFSLYFAKKRRKQIV